MLKVEMEKRLKEYEEIIGSINYWLTPKYRLNKSTPKDTLVWHLDEIKKLLDEKYYRFYWGI